MLANYFLLFFRNLKRQKLFSFINLLGLTISIACTTLLYLYVKHEFSFDKFHAHSDRIYRVNQTFIWGENNNSQFASTGPGVAYAIKEELPGVELMTSLYTPGNFITSYTKANGEVATFQEAKVFAADSNFFNMFSFQLMAGNPSTALKEANTVVLTEATAKKYFGSINPIGQQLKLQSPGSPGESVTYEVTGVVKTLPTNTYFDFDMLLSMNSFPSVRKMYWSWVWTQLETYVRFAPGTDMQGVSATLATIPPRRAEETIKLAFNSTYQEYINSGKKWDLFLQPLTSIHLPPETVLNRLNDSGNISVIYAFVGAAIFIVLLSCINFMNLSTAQFTKRLKEASVRKILGLKKWELSAGFLVEAFAFCLIAMVLALAVAQLLLQPFNLLTEKSLELNLFADGHLAIGLGCLAVLMTVASGIYPSIFLSSFNPVEAIKGKIRMGNGGRHFRTGLVVFQFTASILLLICTGVVFQQLQFVQTKDIGFNKNNLLTINHLGGISSQEALTKEIQNVRGVASATRCSSVPPRIWGGDTFGVEEQQDLRIPLNYTSADEQYLPTLNIRLVVGRNFSDGNAGDVNSIIVNEATVRKIGWPIDESILGKKITYENAAFEIIGVVADFNYWSLANPVEPFAIFHVNTKQLYAENQKFVALRFDTQANSNIQETISQIQILWKKHTTEMPFDYAFVDEAFASAFSSQKQFGFVLMVMATLAILIACLGLLGMIVYALEQRTKEIGIRKVSGATVWNILQLISKSYTILIVVSFAIGAPLSYWLMTQWLKQFPYKVEITPGLFVGVGLTTLALSILVTGYHSLKAATTNPVDVLKDE